MSIVLCIDYNLFYRWFVGIGMDSVVGDRTTFTKTEEISFADFLRATLGINGAIWYIAYIKMVINIYDKAASMSQTTYPKIRKAEVVRGETMVFRDACVLDAEFILSLRTNENKSRFLSATRNDLEAQKAWLFQYATANDQAYFIIEFNDEPIGTVRLYDAQQDSFCWGSWILKEGRPRQAAMESALMVYAYAVNHLGFKGSHFDVRKGNERVWQFHERFGAQRVKRNRTRLFLLPQSRSNPGLATALQQVFAERCNGKLFE